MSLISRLLQSAPPITTHFPVHRSTWRGEASCSPRRCSWGCSQTTAMAPTTGARRWTGEARCPFRPSRLTRCVVVMGLCVCVCVCVCVCMVDCWSPQVDRGGSLPFQTITLDCVCGLCCVCVFIEKGRKNVCVCVCVCVVLVRQRANYFVHSFLSDVSVMCNFAKER